MKYSKWIGYEFASNFEKERFPTINFPNGLYEGTVSGYLKDIIKPFKKSPAHYIVELRYRNSNYEEEVQEVSFTCDCFKRTFYDETVLPKNN